MKKDLIINYKGVPLTHDRTEQMIDTIIKAFDESNSKGEKLDLVGLAKELGLVSFHPLVSIVGYLKKQQEENGIDTQVNTYVKKAKNTFKNHNGGQKNIARNKIAYYIMKTKRQNSYILTLPADKWIMEKLILNEKNGYKFSAVEKDDETYQRMLINLSQDQMLLDAVVSTNRKTIGEVIVNDKEDTYSSVILDYCGFIDSFYDEIIDMMKRKLVRKGGYYAITLAENDRAINNPLQINNYSNTFITNCCANKKVNGDVVTTRLIENIIFNSGGHRLIEKFNYRDNISNMMLFIIQRTI